MKNSSRLFDNNKFIYLCLFILIGLYLAFVEKLFPNSFLTSDNATYYLPSYVYNIKSIFESKTLPLINFYQYLGNVHLAQGQTGVLYFPIYLSGILSKLIFKDYLHTMIILGFLHFYIASIGMFLILKRFQVKSCLALITTLMWITFPYHILVGRGWIFVVYSIAYIPINFLLLDNLLKSPKIKYAIFLAILKSMFFFQGYIQYVFMLFFVEILYFALYVRIQYKEIFDWHSLKKLRENLITNSKLKCLLKYYFSSILLFLGLIPPLLFPMFNAQRESFYRSHRVPIWDFLGEKLTVSKFFKTQFFNFDIYGAFTASNEIFFIGVINLFLLISILIFSFRGKFNSIKHMYLFLTLAFVTLFLSTRFYIIFYTVPIFNYFRWPFKYYLFFLFFLTITISIVLNHLLSLKRKNLTLIVYILVLVSICLNLYAFYQDPDNVLDNYSVEGSNSYLDKYVVKSKGRIFSYNFSKKNYEEVPNFYTHNFATLFQKFHFGGYDPLRSDLINNLTLGIDLSVNNYNPVFNKNTVEYLDEWNVKYYVISSDVYNDIGEKLFSKFKILFENKSFLLLESPNSYPYVYYSNEINNNIKYDFGVNKIDIYPIIDKEKELVVGVAPLKNYKFSINGIDKGFIKHGLDKPRISIDKEAKIVTLQYIDYYFYIGLLVLLLTAIAIIFLLIQQKNYNK